MLSAGSTPRRQRQAGAAYFSSLPRGGGTGLTVPGWTTASRVDHLTAPRGRGRLRERAARGRGRRAPPAATSSGSRCGWRATRVAEAGFDAQRLRRRARRRQRRRGAARGRAAARRRAHTARRHLRRARRPVRRAAATPPSSRPTPSTARSAHAAARRGGRRSRRDPSRTLVAMSGGVDSAVAAQLAPEAGHEVRRRDARALGRSRRRRHARAAARRRPSPARARSRTRMGLPHFTLDLREALPRARWSTTSWPSTRPARTPNPCVRCNGLVRFDAMLALADRLGAARLATGHYARIARDEHGPLVRAAADANKDQSYMLARLAPGAARPALVPARRARPSRRCASCARAAGLPVADKAESPGPLLPRGHARATSFLAPPRRPARARGEIVDRDGSVLGRHRGQERFTVGQRRGLGVAAPEPLYVLDKDAGSGR